jgi:hypothetical protein
MNSFIEDIEKLRLFNTPLEAYVELIYKSTTLHPVENDIIAVYIRDINSDKGYIINISHNDLNPISKNEVINTILKIKTLFVIDKKSFYHYFYHKNVNEQSFTHKSYKPHLTNAHNFFIHKNIKNVNEIIPIVKHYESCEENFISLKRNGFIKENSVYLDKLSKVFYHIESNGIKVNPTLYQAYFNKDTDGYVYTQYNLNTTTSRPANSFGGVNFAALKKGNNERECFIPRNDLFIEMDISAYHPCLLSHLLSYDFPDDNIHQYFADLYKVDYAESKLITFQQTYGKVKKEYEHIEFFQRVTQLRDELWDEFQTTGYITCPISEKRFNQNELEDMRPSKLLNYLLQALETATNVEIMWDVIKILKGKKTKIVLYTYDSILIDLDENERDIIEPITQIFKNKKLTVKLNQGLNYNFQ